MRAITTTDDRGVTYRFYAPPARIVSLVPSDTYTLYRLGAGERLVGRTSYCVEPEKDVSRIPIMGGTKDPDIEKILDARPDVVIMNQEENTRAAAHALEDRGVKLFVTFPKRVGDGVALVARLAQLLGDVTPAIKDQVRFAYRAHQEALAAVRGRAPVRAFVPIWMDPLMTVHGDTYISDMLSVIGATNVFADRRRLFPLAADLGRAPSLSAERTGDRDTRYPRVTLEEVVERRPELVLLPDEPHPFGEEERAVFLGLDIPAARDKRVHLVVGRDLMWPGLRSLEGIDRLRRALDPIEA